MPRPEASSWPEGSGLLSAQRGSVFGQSGLKGIPEAELTSCLGRVGGGGVSCSLQEGLSLSSTLPEDTCPPSLLSATLSPLLPRPGGKHPSLILETEAGQVPHPSSILACLTCNSSIFWGYRGCSRAPKSMWL